MRQFITLAALTVIVFSTSASAQEKSQEKVLELESQKVGRTKFIDFSGDLQISSPSLDALGEQIDQARLDADPVRLALAAKLLAAAEEASGRTARVDSKKIASEAEELAKLRGIPDELRIVAALMGGTAAKELEKKADVIEEAERAGETSKSLDGRLVVDNHSHSSVRVYADGRYIGHVHPHEIATFHVHAHFVVEARDDYGHRWYGDVHFGHYHSYRLLIHPPHSH